MVRPYVAPKYELDAYTCPHCDTFAHMGYRQLAGYSPSTRSFDTFDNYTVDICARCGHIVFWLDAETMIYPHGALGPLPHPDMPTDVQVDFLEARSIAAMSPRGAAALLRLAIQKLCKELGASGDNIDRDIAYLVERGMRVDIQQALDIVRVVGNESVHPGEIDLRDDPEMTGALFELVNEIVDEMISRPKKLQALYLKLPQDKRDGIERRNAKAKAEITGE